MPMSPFVAGLRAKVGTDLLLLPAVALAVFDDQGRVLLARHLDSDAWATIGGAMDPGESPEQAALRELAEETGLRASIQGLVGVYGGPGFEVTYEDGARSSYVVSLFAARLDGGEVVLQEDELAEHGWFAPEDAVARATRPDMGQMLPDALAWWAYSCP